MEHQNLSSTCREDGSISIESGGRLTIENAIDFAACLREALDVSQQVTIAFEANVEVDITALQVLCSACKTAAAKGKILTQQGAGAESLRQLIISAGAERLGACTHNKSNPCTWFGGTR